MNALLVQLNAIRDGELTPVFGLLIDTALKGTLLIAAAAIVAQLLKDRSAAARHAAWTAAVIGHLALPALTLMVPQWRLPLLPAPPWLDAAPAVSAPAIGTATTTTTSTSTDGLGQAPLVKVSDAEPGTAAPEVKDAPITPAPKTDTRWPVISILGSLWILGTMLVLLRLAVGTWKVGRLAKHGDRVDDGDWLSLTQRLANRLQITRPLTLLRGDSLAVPVTWGIVYPAVLLPPDSEEWPESRRRFVLVHEMAHVKRFDALTQLIAQLTVAMLWFDPFMWYAAHRMRVEREHACDDYVLRDGTQPSLYAGELLEMVQSIGSPRHDRAAPAFAALAMARKSEFEGRMLAILNPRQNRHTLGRASAIVASVALALLVLPLAALRPFQSSVATASPAKKVAAAPAADKGNILYPENACDTAKSAGTSLMHVHNGHDDGGPVVEVLNTQPSKCYQAAIVGKVLFANDRVISVPANSYVYLREKNREFDRSLRVRPNGHDTMDFFASLNGQAVEYDDATRAWVSRFLPTVLTEASVDVPQRVARDFAAGGVSKVLSRIATIRNASSRRAHYEALLDGRPLASRDYERIAEHASASLSDESSDLAAVLKRIAAGPARGTKSLQEATAYIGKAQEAGKAGLDHALDTSKSKSDSVAALTQYAVTDDPDMMLFALQGAKGIDSDTDKRNLLQTIAPMALRRKSNALRAAYFDVVATIESDTDMRAVLIAALPYAHIDEAIAFATFKEVQTHLESDTDKRAVLTVAIQQHLLGTSQLRAAFMAAVKTIESSTDYTAVMQAAFKGEPK